MQLSKDDVRLIVDLVVFADATKYTLELGHYDLLKRIAYEFPEYENLCNAYIDDGQKVREISSTDLDCL